jgi:hypothetical protein
MRSVLNQKAEDIQELLDSMREIIGERYVEPYGHWDDQPSVGFRITGIAVTFSVLSEERLPDRHFNVQIESYPSKNMGYFYSAQAVSLWRFLELVQLICGPKVSGW